MKTLIHLIVAFLGHILIPFDGNSNLPIIIVGAIFLIFAIILVVSAPSLITLLLLMGAIVSVTSFFKGN
ncbi:MAG: hypothetical protein FWF81_14515 [Defluviitaleaceae bacterium]|nr:hypothetical protein [Defluviitaleaceae bacterium]